MDKLAAVNRVLQKTGRLPVTVLDTNGSSIAGMAERAIDMEELEIQAHGWHYNTRTDVELTPAVGGLIALPAGTLHIDSSGASVGRNVAQVGDYLFDLKENVNTFTESVRVTYSVRVAFACIPLPVRLYIAAAAVASFNCQFGAPSRQGKLEDEMAMARLKARQFNTDTADVNILDTAEIRAVRGHRDNPMRYLET